jgi:transposase
VAKICGVKKRTVTGWLKNGRLNGLDLPGLGQIVEEKELEQYLKEKRNRFWLSSIEAVTQSTSFLDP